jgi:WhiB family redox-sensing transcriptional regulator
MNDDWREQAVCRGVDPELWFSDDKEDQQAAKNICHRCPVVWQCLDDALATDENTAYGIRAGLAARERRIGASP